MQLFKRRFSLKFFLLLAFIAALLPIALIGWKSLYRDFLEPGSPEISISDVPRGIGLAPVSLRVDLSDKDSGLDEVIVRTKQKGVSRELLRRQLGGARTVRFSIDFPGEKSDLEEGVAEVNVKAFDRSFWSNAAEKAVSFAVDYRKPRIEILTAQHNAVKGGSQLLLYKAFDESLAVSGVKVGNQTFLGYPARGLDSGIEDPAVYAVIYAVGFNERVDETAVRAFAEDHVGNVVSVPVNNRIQGRVVRNVTSRLSEEWLRDRVNALAESNFKKFEEIALREGREGVYETQRGGKERLLEQFKYVNEDLREINQSEIASFVRQSRFEKHWEGPFVREPGATLGAYGEKVNYEFEGQAAGDWLRLGYEFSSSRDSSEVQAAAGGIVVLADDFGVYGRTVIIDHGLGLATLYACLSSTSVGRGETVSQGQKIGDGGGTGLASSPRIYFELRVQNVPVDAREWWDRRWYYAHIIAKINETKRALGLPVYQPLE